MISKQEGIERLAAVPMFSELSKRDIGKLWDGVKVVKHEPGHQVVVEGRTGQGFHLVLAGEAIVLRGSKRVRLGPGAFFGEISLIDDGPRTATVEAGDGLVTATLTAWQFKSVVKDKPAVLWKLLNHLSARLREEQAANNG